VRAAIFDMDGLLIDSEPLWGRAELAVFGSLGVPLTEDRVVETRGRRVDEVVCYWHARYPWSTISVSDTEKALAAYAEELIRAEGIALPGALSALAQARRVCDKVALASSSPRSLIDFVLDRLEIRNCFDVVHSAESEVRGKPDPAVYLTTARLLGIKPASCIALEDSYPGIVAAKSAGMKCIAVSAAPVSERQTLLKIADLFLDSLEDFHAAMLDRLVPAAEVRT
jgi:mannitol-1-/sugar-/sorbitol-6-/2-deoxyglucose-6-phosphatase